MSTIVSYEDVPEKSGKLSIYAAIDYGRTASVRILGDPEGLKYLSELLEYVANLNQKDINVPEGARAHIHIHPDTHMCWHSSEVEICRADASGTGEIPDFMDDE